MSGSDVQGPGWTRPRRRFRPVLSEPTTRLARVTIRAGLTHSTRYTFDHPVKVFPHTVRLRPAPHTRTRIEAYSLTVEPANHFLNWQQDPFGNHVARIVVNEPTDELSFTVRVVADLTAINPFDFFVEDYAEHVGFTYPDALRADLEPYLREVEEAPGAGTGPGVRAWTAERGLDRLAHPQPEDEPLRIVDFLVRLNQAVHASVAYTVRMEIGVQSPDETLSRGLGSCRDSAWLLVAALRHLGLAARFASGYLVQLAPDEAPLDGPAGPTQDFTDLHAWAEVYVPGAGWIGLDPTSGLFAGEGHIPLACTPSPGAAAPIEGATAPVGVQFFFSNEVTRLHETPRVTRPYADEQWADVLALGGAVDELLTAGDVRLTMGGEPTFVSLDDSSTPEWNGAADGPAKRELAQQLSGRLRERLAPGGIVHHGQGKWYPGEPLPRWQIALTWRPDGQPLWQRQDLLANPWDEPAVEPGSGASGLAMRDLARQVAAELGVPAEHCLPAHEDPFDRAWRDIRRPAGERPTDDLAPGADARERAARLDRDAEAPAAWVVPLFEHEQGWGTTHWRLRRERLFLVPGSSPAGYRLPLDSLAWTPGVEVPERDVLDEREALADDPRADGQAVVLDVAEAPRHALVVEERQGHLHVFLPPLQHLERGLELLAALERAAARLGLPLVLEGYPLPLDPRVRTASVTPDPGVIEVNVAPTSSWAELVEQTTALYEDARQSRLSTEKFDLDGTHTGTGGGNHFTLGGASVTESPLLRRPDLLRSMVTYWQHHPALSYLFSGRFIGPTSQAPRLDEARMDVLHEADIAFAELDRVTRLAAGLPEEERFAQLAPQVDGLLRNLLTDLTGNTHRAEFCIDKLYSPGTQRGRLGLLELRGFEMPPHARMALVQALLVRAIVARCWDEPYEAPLVAWGTRLHDRFLLPALVAADIESVVGDLNRWLGRQQVDGHPVEARFDAAWLDPFLEFRFPKLGEVTLDGVHLELRQAIEPWHVLGEQATATGTARYVDSSVERVQVLATGLVEGRHGLRCNGVPVPLVPIGAGEAAVAGVRFRAWDPPSALHPTLGVHAPLRFDLVDLANGASLGGFVHHVSHPGGRANQDRPVNALAAETRRAARFSVLGLGPDRDIRPAPLVEGVGHGPGSGTAHLYTTDLRRFTPGRPSPRPDDPGRDESAGTDRERERP